MYTDYLNQPEYRNEILAKDSENKGTNPYLTHGEIVRAKNNIALMLARITDHIELLEAAVVGHIDYCQHNSEVVNFDYKQLDDDDLLNSLGRSLAVLESQYSLWSDGESIPDTTKTISKGSS